MMTSRDSQNRLVSCAKGATTSAFLCGADGLRRQTSVTTGGTTTVRKNVLDNGMMIRELDGAGVAKTTYLQGASGAVYRREDLANNVQNVTWYVYDGLGSVACELNPNGTVAGRRVVDAYGMTRTTSGSGGKHGFVGQLGHTTDETGLVYMRARHYDPVTGRFQSQDPKLDGNNWFAYCDGDPINKFDPDGKSSIWTSLWFAGGCLFALLAICEFEVKLYPAALDSCCASVWMFAVSLMGISNSIPETLTNMVGGVAGGAIVAMLRKILPGLEQNAKAMKTLASAAVVATVVYSLYVLGAIVASDPDFGNANL